MNYRQHLTLSSKVFILVLCVHLFSCLVFAAEKDDQSIGFYITKADSDAQKGKLFNALEYYQQALDKGGNSPNIAYQRSVLYYHVGFIDKAISEIIDTLKADPSNDYLNHRLGVLYFAKDDFVKAREQFIKALKINPGSTDSHYYLAHVFLRQGLPLVSKVFAYSAHQLGHPALDVLKLLGIDLQSPPPGVWLTDQSNIYLRQISARDHAHSEMIMDYLKSGDLFENIARIEFDSKNGGYSGGYLINDLQPFIVSSFPNNTIPSLPVVAKSENSFTVVQRIAPIDWQRITPMYALSQTENFMSVDSNFDLELDQALSLWHDDELDGAEAKFKQLIKSNPDDLRPYNNLASLYASQGNYEQARECLEQALATDKKYAIVYRNLDLIDGEIAPIENRLVQEFNKNKGKLSLPVFSSNGVVHVEGLDTLRSETKAKEFLAGWAQAWSGKDVEKYLGSYSADFTPAGGLDRNKWETQRRHRLENAKKINVELSGFKYKQLAKDRLQVELIQSYRSDVYTDKTIKSFTLETSSAGWRIVSENVLGTVR